MELFPGLQRQNPQNGNFPIDSWRLSGSLAAKVRHLVSWRLIDVEEARRWRAFLSPRRELSEAWTEWPAGGRIQTRTFPFRAETTGNQVQTEHCYVRWPPDGGFLRSPRRVWGRSRAAGIAAMISGDFYDKSQIHDSGP